MKYSYFYKTSDGVRHEAAIEAESRDEVFATLRKRGIRPIKVVAADGSKSNGEIRGVRKRVVAGLVAFAAIGVGVVSFLSGTHTGAREAVSTAEVAPRHQIYGDPAILEPLERGEFSAVLAHPMDRALALFAQPGRLMTDQAVGPNLLPPEIVSTGEDRAGLKKYLRGRIEIGADEPREVRELKAIVNGMRLELSDYLSEGSGTIATYWKRLWERLYEEQRIYNRTKLELEKETSDEIRDERNAALRALGIRTIPKPKKK